MVIDHRTIVWFVCLFGIYRPTWESFTHMEMSPLPVKGCKFWPMLGTHGHWAVRVLYVPHLLWHGASVNHCHLRGTVTLTHIAERLAVELSLPVGIRTPNLPLANGFYYLILSRLGFEHPTFRLRDQRGHLRGYKPLSIQVDLSSRLLTPTVLQFMNLRHNMAI